MSSAQCQVSPPANSIIVGGVKVYRCTGVIAIDNSSDADVYYNVDVILRTSLGHHVENGQRNVVAPPGSSTSGPYHADIPADSFTPGDVVRFDAQIGVTGGFSGTDLQSNQLTIQ